MHHLTLNRTGLALLLGFLSLNAQAQASIETLTPATVAVLNETDWLVRPPVGSKLVFKGMPSLAGSGSVGNAVSIPAPGVAGLVASLVVYGLIASTQQSEQRIKAQAESDKVLAPYKAALDQLSVNSVVQTALDKSRLGRSKTLLATADAKLDTKANPAWLIELIPIFTFTQDERAIVLDNLVSVYSPSAPPQLVYKNVVRVVSNPLAPGDAASPLQERWTASNGRLLGQEAAGLLAESVDLVLGELAIGPAPSAGGQTVLEPEQQTIRYSEGGLQKVERATLTSKHCGRLTLKTLRGWLMSVPVKNELTAEQCGSASPANK